MRSATVLVLVTASLQKRDCSGGGVRLGLCVPVALSHERREHGRSKRYIGSDRERRH
jgi:hypothetical protein